MLILSFLFEDIKIVSFTNLEIILHVRRALFKPFFSRESTNKTHRREILKKFKI